MKLSVFYKVFFGLSLTAAWGGCASSRSAWIPLTPVGHSAPDDIRKIEKTHRGITVSAKLLRRSARYVAQIEIRNDQKRKSVRGPDDIVLQNGDGLLQPALSAEDLKQEIRHYAASEAAYSLDYRPYYGYAPRRIYGRRRHRYGFVGSFYYNDWFERRAEAEHILEQADEKVASLDADYLHSQEIAAHSKTNGFVQFAKKPEKGRVAGPLKLSLTVEKKVFVFEFFSE